MQSTNEIKHHIDSVEKTRKITNAMNLISSARVKKAMQHIEYNNRYSERVRTAMKDILVSPHPVEHPYLNRQETGKRAYFVIAGDKGMVGSYNSEILNFAYKEISGCEDYILVTIGMVAEEFFRKKGIEPSITVPGLSQDPSLFNARQMVGTMIERFDNGEARSVYIIFTSFVKDELSGPVMKRILPIRLSDYEDVQLSGPEHEILYLPNANEVFERLVPQYLIGLLFGALVESHASEHFARMNAMQSATENADELLKKLRLRFNMARQAAVTREIAEISSAERVEV